MDRPYWVGLERAVIRFQLRASSLELILADTRQRCSCRRSFSQFLPRGTPARDGLLVLCARSFGNFRRHAVVVGCQEAIAFLDTDLIGGRDGGVVTVLVG